MYVEDLLIAIWTRLRHDNSCFDGLLDTDWHKNFISSVGEHISTGKSLSTKQGKAILRLIDRVRRPLVRLGMATDDDIDHLLRHPEYRRPLYESANIPREVRYLGDNVLGFRFKQYDAIVNRLRDITAPVATEWYALDKVLPRPQFHWGQRIWLVPVLRHTIGPITMLINEFSFDVDDATLAYLRLARQSRDQASSFRLIDDGIMHATIRDDPMLAGWITEIADGVML